MPMQAWQYSSALEPARMVLMRLRAARMLPLRGRGRMHGTLLGVVTVADGDGAGIRPP